LSQIWSKFGKYKFEYYNPKRIRCFWITKSLVTKVKLVAQKDGERRREMTCLNLGTQNDGAGDGGTNLNNPWSKSIWNDGRQDLGHTRLGYSRCGKPHLVWRSFVWKTIVKPWHNKLTTI